MILYFPEFVTTPSLVQSQADLLSSCYSSTQQLVFFCLIYSHFYCKISFPKWYNITET